LLTGDSSQQVIDHIQQIVDDKRVTYTVVTATEPSSTTSVNSFGYRQVEAAAKKTFPEVVVVPFLLIGGTDSHFFQHLCNSTVRFTPAIDPTGLHDINERISIENFKHALWFYEQLIRGMN
jgi:carboxypeptidase PM20D1